MAQKRRGNRYPLLFYRRTMKRLAIASLLFGLVLSAIWWWRLIEFPDFLFLNGDTILLTLTAMILLISAFAFVGQYMSYVRPYRNYLLISTPLLKLRISYRRIRSVRPALIQQIFQPDKLNWSQRRFLAPFHGKTALVLDLRGYPMSPALLRFFFPKMMFYPQGDGFVLLVDDWMKFSTEFDSFTGAWLQYQGRSFRR